MGSAMRELRTAVMILVDVSWEGHDGVPRNSAARMEDKSPSGACLRIKAPVELGQNLRVQWRFEQFSGVCKYCRSEGREYIIGILRTPEAQESMQRNPVESAGKGGTRAESKSEVISPSYASQFKASAPARVSIMAAQVHTLAERRAVLFQTDLAAQLRAPVTNDSIRFGLILGLRIRL